MKARSVNSLALAVSALTLGGCAEDGLRSTTAGVVVRDSMGIRIVENTDSLWTTRGTWTVAAEPRVVIGSVDGLAPGTDFGSIIDVVRFRDGRIAVADVRSNEVRIFDPAGTLLLRLGGTGDGPAEFRRVNRIGIIRGDTLAVEDLRGSRTTYFSSDGTWARTESEPPSAWNELRVMQVMGWLNDGSMVATHSMPLDPETGSVRLLWREWHLFDPNGNHLRPIATLPVRYDNFSPEAETGSLELFPQAFAVVSPTGLWFAFANEYEVRHYGPEGIDRIVRRTWTPNAVPEGAGAALEPRLERDLRNLVQQNPPDMRGMQLASGLRSIASVTLADSFPAFSEVILGTDGYLCVRNHVEGAMLACPEGDWDPLATLTHCNSFTIFDPDGRWLGTVETPRGMRVFEVGDDYVLGVRRDELDVQYVVLHEILKAP